MEDKFTPAIVCQRSMSLGQMIHRW